MEDSDIDWKDPCELGICDYGCKHEDSSNEDKVKVYQQVVTIVLSGTENQRYIMKVGTPPEAKAERLIEFYCSIMHVDAKDYNFNVHGKIIDPSASIGSLELGPSDVLVGCKKQKEDPIKVRYTV